MRVQFPPSPMLKHKNSKEIGTLGEDLAVKYLKIKGYEILERNFQMKVSNFLKSEIDIIAKEEDIVHFVEVKTLRQAQGKTLRQVQGKEFFPEEKVNFEKKKKIIRAAETWLSKNKIPLDSQWQIDIIAIVIEGELEKAKVSFFQNI